MQPKKILAGLAFLLAAAPALAQDRIYTRDGAMYEVKIKEIGTRTIVYKKWNNLDGPDFVLPKGEVERIRFENGDEDNFGKTSRVRPAKDPRPASSNYGQNILSMSPIHMTNVGPLGLGLMYERMIDVRNIVSFYLPVVYSFSNNQSIYNPSTGINERDENSMFWFYPGVKIYPTGSDGIVRYAVGPSLAFGTGSRNYGRNIYDPGTGTYQYKRIEDDIFVMGIVVNNSLNIQPTPRLHLGLELGLGIPYYSTEPRDLNYDPYNELYNAPLVQFNFHVGYRF